MPEIIIFFAFITTLLWLIIGWRAMRAHERIATSVANYVDSREHDLSAQFRSEAGQPIRRFREPEQSAYRFIPRVRIIS